MSRIRHVAKDEGAQQDGPEHDRLAEAARGRRQVPRREFDDHNGSKRIGKGSIDRIPHFRTVDGQEPQGRGQQRQAEERPPQAECDDGQSEHDRSRNAVPRRFQRRQPLAPRLVQKVYAHLQVVPDPAPPHANVDGQGQETERCQRHPRPIPFLGGGATPAFFMQIAAGRRRRQEPGRRMSEAAQEQQGRRRPGASFPRHPASAQGQGQHQGFGPGDVASNGRVPAEEKQGQDD